jgi:hypothetical protein
METKPPQALSEWIPDLHLKTLDYLANHLSWSSLVVCFSAFLFLLKVKRWTLRRYVVGMCRSIHFTILFHFTSCINTRSVRSYINYTSQVLEAIFISFFYDDQLFLFHDGRKESRVITSLSPSPAFRIPNLLQIPLHGYISSKTVYYRCKDFWSPYFSLSQGFQLRRTCPV